MKKNHLTRILTLFFIFVLLITVTACEDQHDIIDEPDITVEYLSGDYADQLLRDGGNCTLGTISITGSANSGYELTVNSMLIVESEDSEDGYYIADKNMTSNFHLDSEARVTYIQDPSTGPEIIELSEFIEYIQEDASASSEDENENLYNVYTIGDNALMILAQEMPEQE